MKDVLIAKSLINVPHVKWLLLKRGMGNGEWEIKKCEIKGSVKRSRIQLLFKTTQRSMV